MFQWKVFQISGTLLYLFEGQRLLCCLYVIPIFFVHIISWRNLIILFLSRIAFPGLNFRLKFKSCYIRVSNANVRYL